MNDAEKRWLKTNLYIYIFKYRIAFNTQKREKINPFICLYIYI